ncbi:MAG: hypothetical protein HY048_03030 [Acidobacteria bacterium]|nr:hypothetical protein [Acidobacteriota bacterium]
MLLVRMRVFAFSLLILALAPLARAQDPPPRIGPLVVDLHGTFLGFPEDQLVADSRGMTLAELPGSGLGVQVGIHVYPVRWKAITFGVGGEFARISAGQTPVEGVVGVRAAEERFSSLTPQVSFNFGTGHGWSYLSAGFGSSTWSLVPQGQDAFPPDSDNVKTLNYGGGARWFAKRHVGVSFDLRVYAINPGSAAFKFPQRPRTSLMMMGAGVSVK